MIRYFIIALLIIITCIASVQADDNADHIELLSKHYNLQKPEGEGPFPAVILVSGCSGFNNNIAPNFYNDVQNRLVELGFVTLRVDYLAARNIPDCSSGVSSNSAGGDICIAAEHLANQKYIKKGAINVIGWSFGGAAVFRALRRTESRAPLEIDSAVTYYPYCAAARPWESEVPVLVLMGTKDEMAPISACEDLFSRLNNRDRITLRVYDDSHHCFDMPELPPEMKYRFGTIGYNKAAAESSWNEVEKFLKR